MPGLTFGSMSCKAHQAHIALSESMTSIVQQSSSLGSRLSSHSLNLHYNQPSSHWPCIVLFGGRQRKGICYLCQQHWGLRSHHQPKLLNVGSASLPPAEAEDVESNQPQPRTQHSLTDQSQQFFFFFQTALLRANHRKSYNQTTLLRANLRISS